MRWLGAETDIVRAVRLSDEGLLVELPGNQHAILALDHAGGERVVQATRTLVRVLLPIALPLRGGKRAVTIGERPASQPDATLIAALRRAHRLAERERGIPLVRSAPASPYERKILQLAYLAPELQQDILRGRQPSTFTLELFKRVELPLSWAEQRVALGWGSRGIA